MKPVDEVPKGKVKGAEGVGHPQLLRAVLPCHQGGDRDRGRRDRRHGQARGDDLRGHR